MELGRVYDTGVGSYDYGEDQTSMPFTEGNFTVTATAEGEDDDFSGGIGFGTVISVDESDGLGAGLSADETNNTEERNWVVVGVLIALIIVLWMILGAMLCVPLTRCIRRRMPVSKKRINRRYETIEGWLITKTVKSHDDSCDKLQKKFPPKSPKSASSDDIENQNNAMKHTESYDTADTTLVDDNLFSDQDERECPICMEQFEEGDVVSWSSYEVCSHTYHHQCIKEWLLRHNNCPFCREIFLPVDNVHTKITMKVFKELSDLRARHAEKTYYCIQDGLVTLADKCYSTACARKTSTSSSITATTQPSILRKKCAHIRSTDAVQLKEKLKAGVTKADLKKLRGNRCDKICYDDAPVPDIIDDQEMPSNGDHVVIQSTTSLAVPLGADTEDVGRRTLDEPADVATLEREDSSSTVSSHDRGSSVDFESVELESPTSRKDSSVFDCPISPIDTVCETDDEIDDSDRATDNEETNSQTTIEQPCSIPVEEMDKEKPCEIQSEESDRKKSGDKGDSGDSAEKALSKTTTDSSCAQNSSNDNVTMPGSEDTAELAKVRHEKVIEKKARIRNFDDSRHSTMEDSAAQEPFPEQKPKEERLTLRQEDLVEDHVKDEAQGSSNRDEESTTESAKDIPVQRICIVDNSLTNATSNASNKVDDDESELPQRILPLLPSF